VPLTHWCRSPSRLQAVGFPSLDSDRAVVQLSLMGRDRRGRSGSDLHTSGRRSAPQQTPPEPLKVEYAIACVVTTLSQLGASLGSRRGTQ
jgi:hypothetical protein